MLKHNHYQTISGDRMVATTNHSRYGNQGGLVGIIDARKYLNTNKTKHTIKKHNINLTEGVSCDENIINSRST